MSPVEIKAGGSAEFECTFENILGFKGFRDDVTTLGQVFKEFSWSKDGKTYSYWTELNRQNLQNITFETPTTVYLKVRYSLNQGPQQYATINSIEIFPICSDTCGGTYVPPLQNVSTGTKDIAEQIVEIAQGTFNPYTVNTQYNLYTQLSNSVSNMFGIDSPYFRATPVDRSGDVIFKEWTLYNVEDPKCVKVLVENNEMPDMNAQYNPFGVEYTAPFEVEIVREEFQKVFGVDAVPQKNDILYIPMLSTRLFEVTSSTPNYGFMYQEISWKLSLGIYKPKSNRNLSDKALDILDNATKSRLVDAQQNMEELFGDALEHEEKNLTVPQVNDPKNGTSKDAIRAYVDRDLLIEKIDLDNHGVKVANSCYDFSSLLGIDTEQAVIYNRYQNFKHDKGVKDFAFTTWVSPVENTTVKTLVKKVEKEEDYYKLTNDKIMTNLNVGDFVTVERQGKLAFFGNVVSNEGNIVKVKLLQEMQDTLDSISNVWANASGYILQKTIPSTLLHGYKDGKGIKLEMFCGRYFLYTINDKHYLYDAGKKLDVGNWYGVALNYTSNFNQVKFGVYKIGDDIKSSKLDIVKETVKNIVPEDFACDGDVQFIMKKGLHKQTNIRIYDEAIPDDKLSSIMNQYVISDSYNAILVDNAVPVDRLPYLGNIK